MSHNRLIALLIALLLASAIVFAATRLLESRRKRRNQRRRARHISYQRFWDKLVPRLRPKQLTYRRPEDEPPRD